MSLDRTGVPNDNHAMQPPDISPEHLTRVDPEQNMARFYGIAMLPTLFGEVSLVRNWGRIGTRGQAMMVTYENEAQASAALEKLAGQKRRRGYWATEDSTNIIPARRQPSLCR